MSITLLCLVKGNTTANAFSVKISRDKPISELKKAIKAEKASEFDNFPADRLKLWKVMIPNDRDDQLRNLILQDNDKLLAIKKILKYFPDSPSEEHIRNYLRKSPHYGKCLTSLFMIRNTVYEILERKFLRYENLLTSHCITGFDVVVSPKRKAFKWTANIEHATLKDLKDYIHEMYQPPALENNGAVLNFMNDEDRYYPRNNQDLREMLRIFVTNNNLRFTVFIETSPKPFNSWTFPKVCELYGLSDDPNPSIFNMVV